MPDMRDDERCRGLTVYGRRCRRKADDNDPCGYCWRHYSQGEYERERDHAYAAHTAVY